MSIGNLSNFSQVFFLPFDEAGGTREPSAATTCVQRGSLLRIKEKMFLKCSVPFLEESTTNSGIDFVSKFKIKYFR